MSSTQLQNRSFRVVERTRMSSKCQKMKNARAKRAKILVFIVNYANLWNFCCRRRRGCLSSLFLFDCPAPFLKSTKLQDCKGLMHEKKLSHWSCAKMTLTLNFIFSGVAR